MRPRFRQTGNRAGPRAGPPSPAHATELSVARCYPLAGHTPIQVQQARMKRSAKLSRARLCEATTGFEVARLGHAGSLGAGCRCTAAPVRSHPSGLEACVIISMFLQRLPKRGTALIVVGHCGRSTQLKTSVAAICTRSWQCPLGDSASVMPKQLSASIYWAYIHRHTIRTDGDCLGQRVPELEA